MATAKQNELGKFLAPLTNLAAQMILAGVLKKNVIAHFTNKGLPFAAAENITEVGVFMAEEQMKNKSK
jgi:D-alanyl-lipoteichoic acid acyltransferase DltB (MBOAT superfamily)